MGAHSHYGLLGPKLHKYPKKLGTVRAQYSAVEIPSKCDLTCY